MSKRIEIASPPNKLEGVLAQPAGAAGTRRAGGVIVVQEWFGITEHIQSLVDRFAGEGFVALAPDLYHGRIAKDDAEAGRMMRALDFPKAVADIGAAVGHLAGRPECNGKVGVVGFCLGGALTFAAACNVPGLAAAVPFYGAPDIEAMDWSRVTAPVLAHFARVDEWASPEKAEAIRRKLSALGKSMELHVYDAGHAFMRDTDPSKYSAANAKLAWDRTIAFLKRTLA